MLQLYGTEARIKLFYDKWFTSNSAKISKTYLLMCPIAVLIVTFGPPSSGLKTYGGKISSSSTMGSFSVSLVSTDFEHLFLKILKKQQTKQ